MDSTGMRFWIFVCFMLLVLNVIYYFPQYNPVADNEFDDEFADEIRQCEEKIEEFAICAAELDEIKECEERQQDANSKSSSTKDDPNDDPNNKKDDSLGKKENGLQTNGGNPNLKPGNSQNEDKHDSIPETEIHVTGDNQKKLTAASNSGTAKSDIASGKIEEKKEGKINPKFKNNGLEANGQGKAQEPKLTDNNNENGIVDRNGKGENECGDAEKLSYTCATAAAEMEACRTDITGKAITEKAQEKLDNLKDQYQKVVGGISDNVSNTMTRIGTQIESTGSNFWGKVNEYAKAAGNKFNEIRKGRR